MSDCKPLTMDEIQDWFYRGRKVSDVDLASTIKILYDQLYQEQARSRRLREALEKISELLKYHDLENTTYGKLASSALADNEQEAGKGD